MNNKQILTNMLLLGLILIFLSSFANAELVTEVIDDFEDNDCTSNPTWDVTNPEPSHLTMSGSSGYLTASSDDSGSPSTKANAELDVDIDLEDGDIIQFKFKSEQTDWNQAFWFMRNKTDEHSFFGLYNSERTDGGKTDETYMYYDGSSANDLWNGADNTWYDVELTLYPSQDRVDLKFYSGDSTVVSETIYTTPFEGITNFYVATPPADRGGWAYIDDIEYISESQGFSINTTEIYSDSPINNFTAEIRNLSGTTEIYTGNGTVYYPFSNHIVNITVTNTSYYDAFYENYNTSTNLNVSLFAHKYVSPENNTEIGYPKENYEFQYNISNASLLGTCEFWVNETKESETSSLNTGANYFYYNFTQEQNHSYNYTILCNSTAFKEENLYFNFTDVTINATYAISQGISQSLVSSGTIYSDKQVYLVDEEGSQVTARVDNVVLFGEQAWIFNYDNTTSLGLFNLTPSVYVLEMGYLENLTNSIIIDRIVSLINSTIE